MKTRASAAFLGLAIASSTAAGQSYSRADSIKDMSMRRTLDSALAFARVGDPADWRAGDSLLRADPNRELALALKRGDRRLLAYGGIALIAPGIDSLSERCQRAAYRLGLRQLDNSGDVVETRGQEWLKYAAQRFAERYNPLLLARTGICRRPRTKQPRHDRPTR
jgi:hypothetical protein